MSSTSPFHGEIRKISFFLKKKNNNSSNKKKNTLSRAMISITSTMVTFFSTLVMNLKCFWFTSEHICDEKVFWIDFKTHHKICILVVRTSSWLHLLLNQWVCQNVWYWLKWYQCQSHLNILQKTKLPTSVSSFQLLIHICLSPNHWILVKFCSQLWKAILNGIHP